MIKIIIAIILTIALIMFDNNYINIHFDQFSIDNKLDKNNKQTIWIYEPPNISRNIKGSTPSGLIKLCIESIKKHLGKVYNIITFTKNQISNIIPEYMEDLDKCQTDYMFINMHR